MQVRSELLTCWAISGLAEDQLETMIEDLTAYCYKRGITVSEFTKELGEIKISSEKQGIPIENLRACIDREQEELKSHHEYNKTLRTQTQRMLREYNMTKKDLNDYRKRKLVNEGTIKVLIQKRDFAWRVADLILRDRNKRFLRCMRYDQGFSTTESKSHFLVQS